MKVLQILGIALFFLLLLTAIASFVLSIYESVKLVKDRREKVPHMEYINKILIYCGCFTGSFTFMLFAIFLMRDITPLWYEALKAAIGGLVFGASISFGTSSFIIHYYGKNLPSDLDKKLFRWLVASVAVCFISFVVAIDAFADYGGDNFLLPKGISFTKGLVRPDSSDGANIAFYAVCIISGAVFVYFLCDHLFYKKYGKHGLLESTFFIAFPSGIIGARIAYVIGNWNVEFKGREFWHVFAIWEGGLTILGGAIAGIVVGVLWFMHVNKGKSIFHAVDVIVPTILIAQAVGRWGNFFNCEVHGIQMSIESWSWLPRLIVNNSRYSSVNGWADPGMMYVPLFLIECATNLFGYFVLAHLFGIKFKNITKEGDLAFGYIVWYGLTRTFMEPLRDKGFNMGSNGYWSWLWSIIFIAAGVIAIVVNHIVRNILAKKKNEFVTNRFSDYLGGAIALAIGISLIVGGAIMMSNSSFSSKIQFDTFNIGIILLVLGGSIVVGTSIPISQIVMSYANA